MWMTKSRRLAVSTPAAKPPLRRLFDLEPIEPQYWPLLAAFPPLFLLGEECRKLLLRRWQSRSAAQSRER